MFAGVLPIGTVVLLKNSTRRVMITGVCQFKDGDEGKVWDYVGCLFPEGYMGADSSFLFDDEQIEKVYYVGYQDEEQFAFKVKADNFLKDVKGEKE